MAASAAGNDTAPLSQKRTASGGATTKVASALERTAAAANDVVLLRFEPDPQRQPHQPFAHRFGDGHAAAGAAVLQAGGRAVQRHIVEHRVYFLASQGLDEAPARRSIGQDQVIGVGVRRSPRDSAPTAPCEPPRWSRRPRAEPKGTPPGCRWAGMTSRCPPKCTCPPRRERTCCGWSLSRG